MFQPFKKAVSMRQIIMSYFTILQFFIKKSRGLIVVSFSAQFSEVDLTMYLYFYFFHFWDKFLFSATVLTYFLERTYIFIFIIQKTLQNITRFFKDAIFFTKLKTLLISRKCNNSRPSKNAL